MNAEASATRDWRKLADEALARIREGTARPGDGILAWCCCDDDYRRDLHRATAEKAVL